MNLTAPIIAASCGSTVLRAAQWVAPLQTACDRYEINTPLRLSAFLAQVGCESEHLEYVAEIWGPTPAQLGYEGRADLGNTFPGDGLLFRGRGLIQITGRRNYLLASLGLELDLSNHPELLETPVNAARSAAWWWSNRGLNALADQQQFVTISKRINGGTNGLETRQALYAAAKKVLGC
ncbi:glycoside hydrolase family 19 protein [Pararobbsia alpina]|uniref:Glycoside hydrolase family 19 catalytic domain-containing protein n=1 Tax=Pararobbsia alpina TaxID=621374 RepID=A0A6S7B3G6_9BURK|nr:glycoside hydrolase family 19 protein [Pararobbsia alpina]CAB3784214.1 hypothetical protein LMG28138_01764 [Pararobbsia alpina]